MLEEIRINEIELCVRVPQPKDAHYNFRNRANNGILLVEYGKLCYECNGKKYMTDSDHPLFISKGSSYTLNGMEDSMTFVINFSMRKDIESDTIYRFHTFPTSSVSKLLFSMERMWTLRKTAYEYHALSGTYEIIAKLTEQQDARYLPQSKRERISSSISYIENNYSDPNLSNETLAEKSDVSTVYFRKLFHEIYHMPPMRYVQVLRMEKARALLQSGYSSVGETARLVGFNSIYHFSRVFKQTFGTSPVNYCRQGRTEE